MPRVGQKTSGDYDRLLFAIYDDERASALLRAVQEDLADKQYEANTKIEELTVAVEALTEIMNKLVKCDKEEE